MEITTEHHPYLWTLEDLVRKTAALGGFTVGELIGRRRTRPVVTARHALLYCVKQTRPHLTCAEIAAIIKRDRTMVYHACDSVGAFLKNGDPYVSPYVAALIPLAAARRKDWTPRYDATYTTISQKGREWWETYNQTAA